MADKRNRHSQGVVAQICATLFAIFSFFFVVSYQSPLLEAQISGARSAIVNVTGGASMSAYDAQEAVEYIREAAGNDIDIIFGVAINEKIGESIIVTVIATGFDLPKAELLVTEVPANQARPVAGGVQPEPELGFARGLEMEDDDRSGIPNFFNRN